LGGSDGSVLSGPSSSSSLKWIIGQSLFGGPTIKAFSFGVRGRTSDLIPLLFPPLNDAPTVLVGEIYILNSPPLSSLTYPAKTAVLQIELFQE
jgi:hypothetical protein